MDIAGYSASILIGISLGLIGGGGSILTVPVLVYLFSLDAELATSYSLFIVGATSMVGALSYFKKGLVNIKTAIVFGIPSVAAIFLTRAYLLPAVPSELFALNGYTITKNMLLMLLFAILMIAASYHMIKKGRRVSDVTADNQNFNYFLILLQGIATGVITGLVGAGGGFLIIPSLVNLVKLPMKTAVGTSLVIISINSLLGFLVSLPHTSVEWDFLLGIASIAIIGILTGSYLSTKIKANKLKPAFGWFVLLMGIYIVIEETVLH